jgi:hypothetical protein
MPRPKGYRVSPGENPGGRPSVLESDPKLQERIAECFLLGLTDEQTALDCDISVRTVERLRQGKFCRAVKRAELAREKIYRQKVWDGDNGWQGTAWFLERKYPHQFSRPEVQFNLQNNVTNIAAEFTIHVTGERADKIDSRARELRARTLELFANNAQTRAENPRG